MEIGSASSPALQTQSAPAPAAPAPAAPAETPVAAPQDQATLSPDSAETTAGQAGASAMIAGLQQNLGAAGASDTAAGDGSGIAQTDAAGQSTAGDAGPPSAAKPSALTDPGRQPDGVAQNHGGSAGQMENGLRQTGKKVLGRLARKAYVVDGALDDLQRARDTWKDPDSSWSERIGRTLKLGTSVAGLFGPWGRALWGVGEALDFATELSPNSQHAPPRAPNNRVGTPGQMRRNIRRAAEG